MKKFLIRTIAFLLTLIPIYLASLVFIYHTNTAKFVPNVLDKSKNDGFLLTRLRDIPNYSNVDFLFLGSSHACREFDPRIFKQYGFTSFNLGSSAQTPINSEFLLKENISSLKPKHLIFEIYFRLFERDAAEASIDILSNSKIDPYNLKIALSKPSLQIYNTIAFISLNRLIQPLSEIKPQNLRSDKYVDGGYIEKILKDSLNQRLIFSKSKQEIKPRADQLAAMERIIEFTKQQGIQITLVSAPITKEFLGQFENYSEFSKQVKEIAERYQVRYIDYNQSDLSFDSYTEFYDNNHLRQKGVEKFNKHLIETYLLQQKTD